MEPMDIVGKSKEDASLPKGEIDYIYVYIFFIKKEKRKKKIDFKE
jgi:hypothetical protein